MTRVTFYLFITCSCLNLGTKFQYFVDKWKRVGTSTSLYKMKIDDDDWYDIYSYVVWHKDNNMIRGS